MLGWVQNRLLGGGWGGAPVSIARSSDPITFFSEII